MLPWPTSNFTQTNTTFIWLFPFQSPIWMYDKKTEFDSQALQSVVRLPDGASYNWRQYLGSENNSRLHWLQGVEAVIPFEFASWSHLALQNALGVFPFKSRTTTGQIWTSCLAGRSVSYKFIQQYLRLELSVRVNYARFMMIVNDW